MVKRRVLGGPELDMVVPGSTVVKESLLILVANVVQGVDRSFVASTT